VDWLCEQSHFSVPEEAGEEEVEEQMDPDDEDLPNSASLSSLPLLVKKPTDPGDATLSKLFSTNESLCYECDLPVDRDKF